MAGGGSIMLSPLLFLKLLIMAKVGLWLHGARGKLAGATLYKGVGGTQIRQIVDPENPMTEGQAMQRMIFSTVGHAWKALSPYIANKWQNAPNNKIAFRHFFRNNIAYIKAGVLAGTIDHSFNIKGSHVFAPNVYQIASGTLNPITPNGLETINNGTFDISGLNIPCNDNELLDNWEIESNQDYVKVLANIGCKPGDTLTVITVESKENNHDATYNGAVNDRVKINVEFVRFKQNYDEEMFGLMLINADRSISEEFIAEKSNGTIYIGGSVFSLNQAVIGLKRLSDYENYCAGAVIRSRRYTPDSEYDLRELSSNARFVIAESESQTATAEKVLPSYMGVADPTEDKFLNKEIPEYPIYDGGDTNVLQNLTIWMGCDYSDFEDLSDGWYKVFENSLPSNASAYINMPAEIMCIGPGNDQPWVKMNYKVDSLSLNGVKFVLMHDNVDSNNLYSYMPEDFSTFLNWADIMILNGDRSWYDNQELLIKKDNVSYAIKYNLYIKVKSSDGENVWNSTTLFEGTAKSWHDDLSRVIPVPQSLANSHGLTYYINMPLVRIFFDRILYGEEEIIELQKETSPTSGFFKYEPSDPNDVWETMFYTEDECKGSIELDDGSLIWDGKYIVQQ